MPQYSTFRPTHFCASCHEYFVYEIPKAVPSKRTKMSLEEVYTEGPLPNCVRCRTTASVCRIVQYRPPYSSPLHMLRGSGAKTGLVSLAHRGVVVLPSQWPCVDSAEAKCTHYCRECNLSFRKPATVVRPTPPQVRTRRVFRKERWSTQFSFLCPFCTESADVPAPDGSKNSMVSGF
jgi:hypothetical protein